jgi:hypothetical protein
VEWLTVKALSSNPNTVKKKKKKKREKRSIQSGVYKVTVVVWTKREADFSLMLLFPVWLGENPGDRLEATWASYPQGHVNSSVLTGVFFVCLFVF